MATLHQCINYVLVPLAECALNGHHCIWKYERTLSLHLIIASYVAGIPEAEDLLSVKRENRTAMPCQVCEIKRADLADFSVAPKRCWKKIEADLPENAHMSGVTKDRLEFLGEMSVLPVDPVLITYPFVEIHQSVDVYAIFKSKPSHNLPLKVSMLLKEFFSNMLVNESRETRTVETWSGSNRTFKAVKVIIFSALTTFSTDCHKRLVGSGLWKDFKEPAQSNRLTELLSRTGLTDMLKGGDFDSVVVIFFFQVQLWLNVVALNYLLM